jgi:hypothetical protein
MALLSTDVAGQTLPDLQLGLINALEEQHQFLRACPTWVSDKLTIQYTYTLSGGNAVFHAEDGTLTGSVVKYQTITRDLECFSAVFPISDKAIEQGSSFESVMMNQVIAQMNEMANKLGDAVINDDGTSNTIFGLDALASQVANISGNLTRAGLDKLLDVYTFGNTDRWAFVGNANLATKFRDVTVAAGGTTYETLAGTQLNAPTYRGVPFLIDQSVATVTTSAGSTSDMFLVKLGKEDGFSIAYGMPKGDNLIPGGPGPFAVKLIGSEGISLVKNYALTTYVVTQLRSPKALVKAPGINV